MEEYDNYIKEIEAIESWNDKVVRIKEVKEKIRLEQERTTALIDMISNDELKKVKKNTSLDQLLENFNKAETIEDKIKYYQYIAGLVENTEKELFSDS